MNYETDIKLTEEQQATRVAGMQVFGVKQLGEQVESTLLQTYRHLRGSLEGWRSRLQTVVASGDNLDLLDFIQELRNHGKRIKEGRFNRVVAIDPALASAVESSRGYPQGFIGVSVIVLSEIVDNLAELNAASTVEDLQAIFSAIENEISEEPQL